MEESKLLKLSTEFAIDVVNYSKSLKEKKEFTLSDQLLRSGTSIGANINEAQYAQSKADFVSKLTIALKEAGETGYWLKLLKETGYLSEEEYKKLEDKCLKLRAMLIRAVTTTKKNK